MSDDKQKNDFFIIDEDPPKRKRKPARDYALWLFFAVVLFVGMGIGAGAILFTTSPNVIAPLPIVVTTSNSTTELGTPFVPTRLPVNSNWRLVFYADSGVYSVSAENKEPQRIVEQGEAPQFSPDGTRIAYQRDEDDTTHLYVANADGSAEQAVDDAAGVMNGSYRWSPDSARLAYITAPENAATLRIADAADGTNATLISDNINSATLFQWSPNSEMIAFIGVDLELYLVDVASGELRIVTDIQVHSEFLSWSADGINIAYAAADGTTVYITPVVETNPSSNSNYELNQLVRALSWSPEGQHLAFVYNSSPQLLQIVNAADVTQPQRIIVLPDGELRGGLIWRNHELYFALVQCEGETGFSRIYSADLNTRQATEIVDAGSVNACQANRGGSNFWAISPDGTQIAYAVSSETTESSLYLLNLVDDETTTLITADEVYAPAWQP